eukprot:TRINITY_DN12668_c0_g1_i1.p1 TRINITY_DN12668_c0_g1~~TRINITY_DN12668_c0_g1_i1.p1  ORF type:complete len:743 (-),score=166.04 TRINITY_DN12668_c0_g1_i1:281-2509(-)
MARTIVVLLLALVAGAAEQRTHPLVLLPGFASGRLRTWRDAYCKAELAGLELGGSGAMFNVGDSVWVHTPMIVGQRACFLRCMKLVNGTDPEPGPDGMGACKVRADEGLDAISKLDPGIITGPLTDVWWTFIQRMSAEFGIAPEDGMVAAPYDWRLDPQALQYRDNFFTRLRHTIEEQVMKRPGDVDCALHPKLCPGVILVAHSMGNNVMRYFCEWLEVELGSLHYKKWLDRYIYLFVGVGAPWLGAAEGIRSMFSGNTFGLPISTNEAREMGATFGSGWLMMPTAVPDEKLGEKSMVNIKFDNPEGTQEFTAGDFAQGEKGPLGLLKRLGDKTGQQYYESGERYKTDPAVDVFSSPKRPPLARVVCAYGVNRATEAGFHYSWDQDLKRPVLEEVIYEQAVSENQPLDWQEQLPDDLSHKSGDGTVNYASLAWCKRWLGPKANVTLIPDGDVLKSSKTITRQNVAPAEFSKEHSGIPSNTYWESDLTAEDGRQQFTQVWEFENVEHRETIKSPPFLKEFTALIDSARGEYSADVDKDRSETIQLHGVAARRERGGAQLEPMSDAECDWDYTKMECRFQDFCNYDYHFGDLTLSQSCRLRATEVPTHDDTELGECQCSPGGCLEGFCKYTKNCKNTATQPFGPSNGFWGPCSHAEAVEGEGASEGEAAQADDATVASLKSQLKACSQQVQNKKECTAVQSGVGGCDRAGVMCLDQTKLFVFGGFVLTTLLLALSPMAIFNADN